MKEALDKIDSMLSSVPSLIGHTLNADDAKRFRIAIDKMQDYLEDYYQIEVMAHTRGGIGILRPLVNSELNMFHEMGERMKDYPPAGFTSGESSQFPYLSKGEADPSIRRSKDCAG